MISDISDEELHLAAEAIGMIREWFQPARRGRSGHYDLPPSRQKEAIENGAVLVKDRRQFLGLIRRDKLCARSKIIDQIGQRSTNTIAAPTGTVLPHNPLQLSQYPHVSIIRPCDYNPV